MTEQSHPHSHSRGSRAADDRKRASRRLRSRLLATAAMAVGLSWIGTITASAATFQLQGGISLDGEITEAGRDVVTIRTDQGIRLLPTERIEQMLVDLTDGSVVAGRLIYWFDGLYEIETDRGTVRIYGGEIIADLRTPIEEEAEVVEEAAPETEQRQLTEEELRARVASMFTSPQLVDRGEDNFRVSASSPTRPTDRGASAISQQESDETLAALASNFSSVADDLSTPKADIPDATQGLIAGVSEERLDLGDATRNASTPTGPGRVANSSPQGLDETAALDLPSAPDTAPEEVERIRVSALETETFGEEERLSSDGVVDAATIAAGDEVSRTPAAARDIRLSEVIETEEPDTRAASLTDTRPRLPSAAVNLTDSDSGDRLAETDRVADLSALPDTRPSTPTANQAARVSGPTSETDRAIPEDLQANRSTDLPGVAADAPNSPDIEGPLRRLALAAPEMNITVGGDTGATLTPRGSFNAPSTPGGLLATVAPPMPATPPGLAAGSTFGNAPAPGANTGPAQAGGIFGAAAIPADPSQSDDPQTGSQQRAAAADARSATAPTGGGSSTLEQTTPAPTTASPSAPRGLSGMLSSLLFGADEQEPATAPIPAPEQAPQPAPSTRTQRSSAPALSSIQPSREAPLSRAPSAPRAVLPQPVAPAPSTTVTASNAPSEPQSRVATLRATAPSIDTVSVDAGR
ncbi:MAG: hypothetical protein AAFV62_09065, partial [Pseudomonadota bacterium]